MKRSLGNVVCGHLDRPTMARGMCPECYAKDYADHKKQERDENAPANREAFAMRRIYNLKVRVAALELQLCETKAELDSLTAEA
jgi:hypothetical protein